MVKMISSKQPTTSDNSKKLLLREVLSNKRALHLTLIIILTLFAMIMGYSYIGAWDKNHLKNEINGGISNTSESIISENLGESMNKSIPNEYETNQSSDSSQSNKQTSASSSSNTTLTVNGQDIPIPKNGKVNRSIKTNGGNVSVDIESHTSQSANNDKANRNKSSSIEIESDTSTSVESYNEQEVDIR